MNCMADLSTRDRILDAANRLFYAEGVRAVSVDAIAAKAGVTKKTLYYHFRSKDELMSAYLLSRDQPNLQVFRKWFDETPGDIADKVEGIFSQLSISANHPKWVGCGFLRTAAELASMPGHPAIAAGAAHKKRFEAWLESEFLAVGNEPETAAMAARRIVVVMDGAFAMMMIHRDSAYIEEAGRAARMLVPELRP